MANYDKKPRDPKTGRIVMQRHVRNERVAKRVQFLAGLGIKHEDMGKVLGMSHNTLEEHYAADIEYGRINAVTKVTQCLFKYATDPNHRQAVVACIFFLKNRAGWRDVVDQNVNVSGGIDAPPRPESVEEWLVRRKAELDEKRTIDGEAIVPPAITH